MTYTENSQTWFRRQRTSKKHSLKSRLVIRVSVVLLIAWVVGVVYAKCFSYHQNRALLVDQSEELSNTLLSVSQRKVGNAISNSQLFYSWKNGEPVFELGSLDIAVPSTDETYIKDIDGVTWVISSKCEGGDCVVVGLQDIQGKYMVRRILGAIFGGLLLTLAATMVALYYAIDSGLKPLQRLADDLSRSDAPQRDNVEDTSNSIELRPLVIALNRLISGMQSQLEKERQFIDTCAHELRTPVAGLLAQIQCSRSALSSDKQQNSIKRAADQTIRVANQFLQLARNKNSEATDISNTRFDLPELVRQLIADSLPQFNTTQCQLRGVVALPISADPMAIEMVVRNLLENVYRYGQTKDSLQTTMIATIEHVGDMTYLIVEDGGNGTKAVDHDQLTKRFYRANTNGGRNRQGAGLGLSIVEEVAKRYNGAVQIDQSPSLGGLRVKVGFQNICVTATDRTSGPCIQAARPAFAY